MKTNKTVKSFLKEWRWYEKKQRKDLSRVDEHTRENNSILWNNTWHNFIDKTHGLSIDERRNLKNIDIMGHIKPYKFQ